MNRGCGPNALWAVRNPPARSDSRRRSLRCGSHHVAARIIADQHPPDDNASHTDNFPGVEDAWVVINDRVERLAESDPGFDLASIFRHGL